MTFRSHLILLLAAVALVAGCDQSSGGLKPVATEPDIVTIKLAQAADKASQALDDIAGIDQQRNPTPPVEDYSNVPPNLMQPISIRWSGLIESITQTLAEHAGMRFHVKGAQPAAPLTVNVDVYQQPIIHVLRDIGLQAGSRADLAVDANNGTVELRYAASDHNDLPKGPAMSSQSLGTISSSGLTNNGPAHAGR
jgi:defect-in-organelle-trafficking protein DotD